MIEQKVRPPRAPRQKLNRLLILSVAALMGLVVVAAPVLLDAPHIESRRAAAEHSETHTREVLLEAGHTLSALQDAETGARGYLITRDPSFLEPYATGRREVGSSVDRLADLTQDNALQQSQIQQLRSVMAARLAALDETVAQVRAGDEAGLVGRIKVGHGKALMDEARTILGAMTAEQTELLTQRHAANEAAAAREVRFNDAVFGSGFAILFAAAIGTILAIRIAERMRLATEIAATDARLRLFVERAPAAIAMFDKDMHYLMASRRYLEDYALDVSAGAEALVGRSHYDVFPEIPERWHYIHRRVLAGETLSADDDPFPRASGGTDWVRWEMTPWKQPNGEIGGALLMSEVVTARKQAERRRDCLLQLADRLRDAPRDAAATAVAMLGEFDRTCIAGWAEVDDAEAHITVTHEYAGATFSPPIASPGTVTFGAEIIEELRAGCTLVVDASTSKPRPAFIPADLRSLVAIPLLRNGRPRAMLYLCHGEQHAWTKSQTRLAEEVAARSWALIEQTRLQDTLEQTAEEFRTLADGIPPLCWMAEPDGRIYWYSQRCYEYTGLTFGDMQGRGWQSIHDPDALPEVRERWRRAVATASPFEMTFPLRGADGVFRPFLTRVAPVRGPDGSVRRWLGVNIDVREAVERETELRRSEAALRERDLRLRDTVAQLSARTKDLGQANQQLVDEMAAREQTRAALLASEQRFRDFADLGSDWMWETDSDGRFNYFSTAKIHGTPTTEFIGKTRDQIGILDHSSVAHRDYEADLAARLPVHDRVITVIGDGGSVRHARMNARPIFGARGCFHGYRGVGRDITARIEAERSASDAHLALRKSEARFRRVVEDAPNAIVVVGISGTIEMINARTEQMFGHPREALIGQNIATLIPERHRDGHPALFRSFLADLTPRPMGSGRDLYALLRDGGEFPIEIALNPIETEDGLMVLATITDITDRRQKEERIQAALKEKDVLLSEIHHRVKNNLQVVQSLLFLQSGKIADAAAQEALRDCQNRVQSMALIHQTLYASQDFARVNFNPFLNELISSLRKSNGVDRAPIGIRVTAEPIPLPLDTAMPCGLIVNELITNALKHAFKGRDGGEIEVALVGVAPGEAMLSVADDGIGIPDNFNIEDATSLGLQLVLTLADQVGGSLTVNRNNPTQFALRFPIDGNQAVGAFSEKSSPS